MALKVFKLINWQPGYEGSMMTSTQLETSPTLVTSAGTAPYLEATFKYDGDGTMYELDAHLKNGEIATEDPKLQDALRALRIMEEVS